MAQPFRSLNVNTVNTNSATTKPTLSSSGFGNFSTSSSSSSGFGNFRSLSSAPSSSTFVPTASTATSTVPTAGVSLTKNTLSKPSNIPSASNNPLSVAQENIGYNKLSGISNNVSKDIPLSVGRSSSRNHPTTTMTNPSSFGRSSAFDTLSKPTTVRDPGILDNNTSALLSNIKIPKLKNITSVLSSSSSTTIGPSISINPSEDTKNSNIPQSTINDTKLIGNRNFNIDNDEVTIPTSIPIIPSSFSSVASESTLLTSRTAAVTVPSTVSDSGILSTKLDNPLPNNTVNPFKFNPLSMKMPTLKKPSIILSSSSSTLKMDDSSTGTPTSNPEEMVSATTTESKVAVNDAFIPSSSVTSATIAASVPVETTVPNKSLVKKSSHNSRKSTLVSAATDSTMETATKNDPEVSSSTDNTEIIPEVSVPSKGRTNRKSVSSSRRDSISAVRMKGNDTMDEDNTSPVVTEIPVNIILPESSSTDQIEGTDSSITATASTVQPSARKFLRRRKSGLPSPAEKVAANVNNDEGNVTMDTGRTMSTDIPTFSLLSSSSSIVPVQEDIQTHASIESVPQGTGVRRNTRRRSTGGINGTTTNTTISVPPETVTPLPVNEPALQLSDLEVLTAEESKLTMETLDVPSIGSISSTNTDHMNNNSLSSSSPTESSKTKPTKGNGRRRRSAGTGNILKLRSPVQTTDDNVSSLSNNYKDDEWNILGCTLEGGDDLLVPASSTMDVNETTPPIISTNISPLSEALSIARNLSSSVVTTTVSDSANDVATASKLGRKRNRASTDSSSSSSSTYSSTSETATVPKLNSLASLSSQLPSFSALTGPANLPPVVIPRTTSVITESDYTTPRCGASRVIIKGSRTLREPEHVTMARISTRLQAIMTSVSGIMYEPIINEVKKLIDEIDTSNTSVGRTFALALRILASTSAPLAGTNGNGNDNNASSTFGKGKTPGRNTPRASRVKFATSTPSGSASLLSPPPSTSKPFSDLTFFSPSRIYNQDSNFGPLLQEISALGEFVRAVVTAERSSRTEIAAINERNIRRNEQLNNRYAEVRREKGIPEIDEDRIDEDDDDHTTPNTTTSTNGSIAWNPTASYAAMFVPKNPTTEESNSQDSNHSSPVRTHSNTSESDDSLDGHPSSKLSSSRPNSLLGLLPPPQTPLRYASSLSSTSSLDDFPTPVREKKKPKTVRFSTFDFSSINAAPNDLSTSALPIPFHLNRSPNSIRNGVSAGTALHNGARMRDIMEPGCVAFSLADACGAARKLRDVIHARGGLTFDIARERTFVRPVTVGDTTPVNGSQTEVPVAKNILVPFLQILLAVEACGNIKVWNSSMDKALAWYANSSSSTGTVSSFSISTSTPSLAFYNDNWGEVKGVARYYVSQLALLQSRDSPLPLVESLSNAVSSAIRYHLRRALNPHMYDDEETNEITSTRPNDPTITPPPNKFAHVDGPMPGHHHHHAHHATNSSSFGTASTLGMSTYNGGLSSSLCGGIGRGGGGIRQGFIAMAPNTGRLRYNGDDLAALTHRALLYIHLGHERLTELIHPHTLQQEIEIMGPPKRRGTTAVNNNTSSSSSSTTASSSSTDNGLTIVQIVDGAHIVDLEMMVNYAESHAFLRNLFGHESSLSAITADGECWKRLRMLSRIAAEYSCEMEAHLLPLSSVSKHIHVLLSEAEVVDRVGFFANQRLERHTKMLDEYRKKYFKSRHSSIGTANTVTNLHPSAAQSSVASISSNGTQSTVNYPHGHSNDDDVHNDNHERPKKRKNSASRLASPAPADKRRYLELMGADEEEDLYPEPIPPMQLADKLAQVASSDSSLSSALNLSGTDMDTSMENIPVDQQQQQTPPHGNSTTSTDGLNNNSSLTTLLPLAAASTSPATLTSPNGTSSLHPNLPAMDPVTAARVAYLMEHEDILNRKLRFMYPQVQLYHCSADHKEVYNDQVIVTAPGFGGVASASSVLGMHSRTMMNNTVANVSASSTTAVLNLPGLGGLGMLNITIGNTGNNSAATVNNHSTIGGLKTASSSTSSSTSSTTTTTTSLASAKSVTATNNHGALSLSELMTVSDTIARPTTKQTFTSTIDSILNSSQINPANNNFSLSTSQSSFSLSSSALNTSTNATPSTFPSSVSSNSAVPTATTTLSNTSLAALNRLKSFTDQALATGSLPIATLPTTLPATIPPFKLPVFTSVIPSTTTNTVSNPSTTATGLKFTLNHGPGPSVDNNHSSTATVPVTRVPRCGECRLPTTTVPPIASISVNASGTTNTPSTIRCTRCQVMYHTVCVGSTMETSLSSNNSSYRCQACIQSMNKK